MKIHLDPFSPLSKYFGVNRKEGTRVLANTHTTTPTTLWTWKYPQLDF